MRHDTDLVAVAHSHLASASEVAILGTLDKAVPRVPVFSFVKVGVDPATLVTALDNAGVAVRVGDMVARSLLRRVGVNAAVRASCCVYTTTEEIDRRARVVERLR